MKYYKVISNKLNISFYDNRTKQTFYHKENIFSHRYKNGLRFSAQYIADELITAAELKRFYGITPENITEFPFLQPVEIPKTETYFFFGARFQNNNAIYYDKNGNNIK